MMEENADAGSSTQTQALAAQNETPVLSKKAQKRAAKQAKYEEFKLERRAREKEKKKEKKRLRAEKAAAGEIDEDEEERRKKRARTIGPQIPFNARVVVDLGFDDLMSEKEIVSLSSQLAYTYSANRKSQTPFASIVFTSLGGKLLQRLDSHNDLAYTRWTRTEWWKEGYQKLWETQAGTAFAGSIDAKEPHDATPGYPQDEDSKASADETTDQHPRSSRADKPSIVYLTADTDEELSELKEGETYIIGGIVDHNRYKNLCLNKAQEDGVRVARLPIGRYIQNMPTRKVLTVNQVFEILLRWVETRDWERALYATMPKRKFQDSSKSGLADQTLSEIQKSP